MKNDFVMHTMPDYEKICLFEEKDVLFHFDYDMKNYQVDYEMKNLMIDNKEYFSCLGDDMLNYYLKTPIPRFDLKNI